MPAFFWVLVAVVVISTVVGAVAKLFNNLAEANAARARPGPAPRPVGGGGAAGGGGAVRQASSDMDRFLAEIDRLRKKTAEAPPPPPNQAPAAPVVQPERRPDRPRPRVAAEPAEAPRADAGFPAAPPPGPRAGDLPVATVVGPAAGIGAPATRVTRFVDRPRPAAKTPFAKSLTALLASGNGLATAVVLQEIFGPPKSKKG